jgi:hypothetical protein
MKFRTLVDIKQGTVVTIPKGRVVDGNWDAATKRAQIIRSDGVYWLDLTKVEPADVEAIRAVKGAITPFSELREQQEAAMQSAMQQTVVANASDGTPVEMVQTRSIMLDQQPLQPTGMSTGLKVGIGLALLAVAYAIFG